MDCKSSWSSCTFELEDIEIINHKSENEEKLETWKCNQCNLSYLNQGLLEEHLLKKHAIQDTINCRYCNKIISCSAVNKECFMNRKCETCEYKCSSCTQRFLRHSSLVNHEKKHSSPNKKRTLAINKKNNKPPTENIPVSKRLKRKTFVGESEEKYKESKKVKSAHVKNNSKKKDSIQVKAEAVSNNNENSPIKTGKRLSSKSSMLARKNNSSEVLSHKLLKNSTLKTKKTLEEGEPSPKLKQNTFVNNSKSSHPTSNVPNSENSVNYKPFSCHVCGDTFASDNVLLDHIKTHGENAAKSFKCKFCGDEFDDIYKMQYHLAICPLAEDELESSLKQVIPVNFTKLSPGTSNQRRRGRPRKIETTLNHENCKEEPNLNFKKESTRKRKSVVIENNQSEHIPYETPSPKKSKKSQNKVKLSKSGSIAGRKIDYVLSEDNTDVSKENEADNTKKKLHHCPFPRCDFKFTREKALLCHMRNHSDDFDDSLKCHKCDIPFDDIHTLRLHINTCKGIKEEKDDDFNRSRCHDSSPNQSFPRTKKDFACNQCGRSFQNQERLNRHLESCGSKFVCRICKDAFLNQHLLDEHFGSNHPPYTAYHCYSCEEDFISELFLQIHQSDEHGQNLSKTIHKQNVTKLLKDPVRENVPNCLQRRVQRTKNKTKSAIVNYPPRSCASINISPTIRDNKIDCSSVITTGKPTSRVHSLTSRCMSSTNHLFWCPICVVGFNNRNNMRIHLKEKHVVGKHVVGNNSIYSCQICEVQMPIAEMMCYHLELHGSNLLSVNRFSKLIAYVKQNRIGEIDSFDTKIKHEKNPENLSSTQGIESIYVQKIGKERSTKKHIKKKVAPNRFTRPMQQRVRKKSTLSVEGGQTSTSTNLESLLEHNLTNGFNIESIIISNGDKKTKLKRVKTEDVPIDSLKEKSEFKSKNPKAITFQKSASSLRLRKKYGLRNKANRSLLQEKLGSKRVNQPTTSGETQPSSHPLVEVDYSEALKPKEVETVKNNSTAKIKRAGSEVQLRKTRRLVSIKKNKTQHFFKATKTIAIIKSKKSNSPEDLVKPGIALNNDNIATLVVDDKSVNKPKEINKRPGEELHLPKKYQDTNLRTLMPNKHIDYLSNNIETEQNNKQLNEEVWENSIDRSLVSAVVETCSVNENVVESSTNISDFLVDKRSEDPNKDWNSEFNERSIELVTHKMPETPEMSITKECNELKTTNVLQSEDSIDSPLSGIGNKHLSEMDLEHMKVDGKLKVCEDSMSSKNSSAGDSDGISCTMCSESFHNQDDLLDHLATHI